MSDISAAVSFEHVIDAYVGDRGPTKASGDVSFKRQVSTAVRQVGPAEIRAAVSFGQTINADLGVQGPPGRDGTKVTASATPPPNPRVGDLWIVQN